MGHCGYFDLDMDLDPSQWDDDGDDIPSRCESTKQP